MVNPIYKAYEKFDEGIMYFANKAVQGYNWTTGGTKTDLANGLLTVAPIADAIGVSMRSKDNVTRRI